MWKCSKFIQNFNSLPWKLYWQIDNCLYFYIQSKCSVEFITDRKCTLFSTTKICGYLKSCSLIANYVLLHKYFHTCFYSYFQRSTIPTAFIKRPRKLEIINLKRFPVKCFLIHENQLNRTEIMAIWKIVKLHYFNCNFWAWRIIMKYEPIL